MPEITDGCRKAAEEIWNGDYPFDKGRFIEKVSSIIARHTLAGEVKSSLRAIADWAFLLKKLIAEKSPMETQMSWADNIQEHARALLAEMDRDGEGEK